MQLDDWKDAWARHESKLDQSMRINQRLLQELAMQKTRSALAPYPWGRVVEFLLGIGILLAVGKVLAAHPGELLYLVVAGSFGLFAIAMTALCAYLVVGVSRLDFGGSVTDLQAAVERRKLAEYRAFKTALLGGIVFWLPGALVVFEALTGVDALGRVDPAWLASNLLFGLLVLIVGQTLSKRYVERSDLSPWARRFVDQLSGRSLRRASAHLAELASFGRDETTSA